MRRANASLRFVTYLAPSLPREYFAGVAAEVARLLECKASLRCVTATSAPLPGEHDPFSLGEADVGFVCAPGYFWLSRRTPSPIELVGAAPVFGGPRACGRPVYFAEVIVARSSSARSFADLDGSRWISNDPASLSGHFSVLEKLADIGSGPSFFRRIRFSGSHAASIAAVRDGAADAAAIDSNVLALEIDRDPALWSQLRVLESWGPFPIQPIIVRTELAAATKEDIAAAFLGLSHRPSVHPALRAARVVSFTATSDADYASERARFERCLRLQGNGASNSTEERNSSCTTVSFSERSPMTPRS